MARGNSGNGAVYCDTRMPSSCRYYISGDDQRRVYSVANLRKIAGASWRGNSGENNNVIIIIKRVAAIWQQQRMMTSSSLSAASAAAAASNVAAKESRNKHQLRKKMKESSVAKACGIKASWRKHQRSGGSIISSVA